ncbi:MAG: hypothetical protein VB862_02750 [Pirellulaceae bacterium]
MRVLLFKSLSRMTAFVMICLLMAGCAAEESPPAKGKSIAAKSPAAGSRNQSPEKESPPSLQEPPPTRVAKPAEPVEEPEAQRAPPASALPVRFAGLQEALEGTPLDEERIKAHGIRQLSGKHLTLYTDLPRHPAIEELPTVFDLASPQWAGYFQVPAEKVADWHVIGRLMKDKTRFQKAGLLPESLPSFGHGFNYGNHLWVHDQATDYYRRHLLLHEGTHGFMQTFLGGAGPPWYREGMAELLGTHRWAEGKLQLKYFPRDKKETPGWGRIKIIKDEVAAGRGVMLPKVLRFPPTAHRQVEPYAWCWAAATFFDSHPQYQQRFHQLQKESSELSDLFSDRFYERLKDQWPEVRDQWQWFVLNMEYGFDVQREAIDPKPVTPLTEKVVELEVRADRGWQSTGLQLAAGSQVEIVAAGRYQIATEPDIWWCEPNGVTIHYYRQRPLGMLLAAVNGPSPTGLTRLANLQSIGLAGKVNTAQGGVLFLRINESGANLADNKGACTVRIKMTSED